MIEETARVHLQRALGRTSGSVLKTADLFGISHEKLREKMKRFWIRGTVKAPRGADVI